MFNLSASDFLSSDDGGGESGSEIGVGTDGDLVGLLVGQFSSSPVSGSGRVGLVVLGDLVGLSDGTSQDALKTLHPLTLPNSPLQHSEEGECM